MSQLLQPADHAVAPVDDEAMAFGVEVGGVGTLEETLAEGKAADVDAAVMGGMVILYGSGPELYPEKRPEFLVVMVVAVIDAV